MNEQNYLSIYAKSFNWAGFFLPKQVYSDCSNLYDFCRYIDNLADEKGDLDTKLKNFNTFKQDFKLKNENNQIIKKMWALINKFEISPKIIDDLFDGVEADIKSKVEINTDKDLYVYSYRVAGTVGLMMAKILNVKERSALLGAIDLGIAMQLTNIARDVIEDERKNRIYLIKSSEDIFLDIKDIIYKADSFYNSSFTGIKDIPFSCRFSIIVARRVYRQIGKKILKEKDMVNYKKAGKIYVSNFGKIIQTILSLWDLVVLFFIKQKKHEKENEYNLINEDIGLNGKI